MTAAIFGTNWIQFTVDDTDPTGGISAPGANAVIDDPGYGFAGFAWDDVGVQRVVLFIRRNADNLFWNGSTWLADSYQANLSSTPDGDTWTSAFTHPVPGPEMPNGSYTFIAIIFDKAGNTRQVDSAVTLNFHQVYVFNDTNNRNWNHALNWSPEGIPGAEDIAVIPLYKDVFITEDVTVWGLRLTGGSVHGGNPAMTNLTVLNHFDWSTSSSRVGLDGLRKLTIAPGGQLNLTRDSPTDVLRMPLYVQTFDNHGTINWVAGELDFYGVTLNNTGSFIATGNANLGTSDARAPFVINNSGTFIKRSSAGTTQIYEFGSTFNNTGRVEVESGTLALPGGLSSGTFSIAANTTLALYNRAPQALTDGARLSGAGTCQLNGSGGLSMSVSGNVTVDCILELTGNSHLAGGILNTTSGALEGSGTLIGSGRIDWKHGTLEGTLSTAPGFRTNVSGEGGKQIYHSFTNGGTMNWSGPETILGGVGGAINVFKNTGTFNALAAGAFFTNYFYGTTFENSGTLNTFAGGSSQIANGALFINSGVVNVGGEGQAGLFEVRRYDQTASGRLRMELAGTDAAPLFDQVRATQAVTLDGKLEVSSIAGFVPADGAAFPILTYASRTGKFSIVSTVGKFLSQGYHPTDLTLVATSEPATFAEWQTLHFPGPISPGAAPLADLDGDGISNLLEYALSMNPRTNDSSGLPAPQRTGTHLQIAFTRREPSDLLYEVEATVDMITWSVIAHRAAGDPSWTGPASIMETGDGSARTVIATDNAAIGAQEVRDLRLRVTIP